MLLIFCALSNAALIGHWTFNAGQELRDLTGNFGDLQLSGAASIADGTLSVSGNGDVATGIAATGSYKGSTLIGDKTMVVWLTLDSLNAFAGSPISLDTESGDGGTTKFDCIDFGEKETNKWMAGSEYFNRYVAFSPGFTETTSTIRRPIQLAVSWKISGLNAVTVTFYRNGTQLGTYTTANNLAVRWLKGNSMVLFGNRHHDTSRFMGRGALNAHIDEARLYSHILTAAEIRATATTTTTTKTTTTTTSKAKTSTTPSKAKTTTTASIVQTPPTEKSGDSSSSTAMSTLPEAAVTSSATTMSSSVSPTMLVTTSDPDQSSSSASNTVAPPSIDESAAIGPTPTSDSSSTPTDVETSYKERVSSEMSARLPPFQYIVVAVGVCALLLCLIVVGVVVRRKRSSARRNNNNNNSPTVSSSIHSNNSSEQRDGDYATSYVGLTDHTTASHAQLQSSSRTQEYASSNFLTRVNDESKNTFESARHSVIYNNQNDMIPSQSMYQAFKGPKSEQYEAVDKPLD